MPITAVATALAKTGAMTVPSAAGAALEAVEGGEFPPMADLGLVLMADDTGETTDTNNGALGGSPTPA